VLPFDFLLYTDLFTLAKSYAAKKNMSIFVYKRKIKKMISKLNSTIC